MNTSKREQRAVTTQQQAAISIEPKRPLTPAEEHLAQVLAAIARRAGLRFVIRGDERQTTTKGNRRRPKT